MLGFEVKSVFDADGLYKSRATEYETAKISSSAVALSSLCWDEPEPSRPPSISTAPATAAESTVGTGTVTLSVV